MCGVSVSEARPCRLTRPQQCIRPGVDFVRQHKDRTEIAPDVSAKTQLGPLKAAALARFSSYIEEIPAEPILDFDDPKIRIKTDFALQTLFSRSNVDPFSRMKWSEEPRIMVDFALRRGTEQCAVAVEPIDLDNDGAGFGGTTPAQNRSDAFNAAAAQIRGNPDIAAQPHVRLAKRGCEVPDPEKLKFH
jgi:hypothetical protein